MGLLYGAKGTCGQPCREQLLRCAGSPWCWAGRGLAGVSCCDVADPDGEPSCDLVVWFDAALPLRQVSGSAAGSYGSEVPTVTGVDDRAIDQAAA